MQRGEKRCGSGVMAATVLLVCSFGAPQARACTVTMRLQELADHAACVFVGEVASVHSYWAQDPRRIESAIEFTDVRFLKGGTTDIIKNGGATSVVESGGAEVVGRHGTTTGSTFRLIVPGGKIGDLQMRLCCAPELRVGQKWVLFVLPQYRTHPIVGMAQGAFRVVADENGLERVYQSGSGAVRGVEPNSGTVAAVPASPRHIPLFESDGVRVVPRAGSSEATVAMTLESFLLQIQPILDRSRVHELSGPAGQRVPTAFTPVPLLDSSAKRAWQRDGVGAGRTTSALRARATVARATVERGGQPQETLAAGEGER